MKRIAFLLLAVATLSRRCRLRAPRICTIRRRLLPDLRSQNSRRIPRLEIDRRGQPSSRRARPTSLRAQFGNDIAIKAFREGTLPFPDGAINCRDSLDSCPVGIQQQSPGRPVPRRSVSRCRSA